MQMTQFKKMLSLILCTVLIAAMALIAIGCTDNSADPVDTSTSVTTADTSSSASKESSLGEGELQFTFTVTDAEGNETSYQINTDKTTVGEALTELDLLAGEEGDFGLYVKTVNGITVDYDKDGKYWAFYVNGEYATSGVDSTEVTVGATYSFKAE